MKDGAHSPAVELRPLNGNGQAHRRESVLQKRLSLREMLDLPSFSEVAKSFVELYKVGIKVFDEKGAKLVDIKTGNGDFCGYVFSFAEGRHKCTATVGRVKDGPLTTTHGARTPTGLEPNELRGMITLPCFTGLRYVIMPVLWEGDALGRVVFGPFTPDDLQELPPSLTGLADGLDLSTANAHLAKIRRAPEGTVGRVMIHFAQILDTLVAAGQKTFFTSQVHIEATLETNRELETQNRKLSDLYAKLKELDRLKSSFLATVSHELRTPLTSIIGYSEMLAEGLAGDLNVEQVDYVRTIMEKGESLLKLISSILDISQIEAGKVRLNFEPSEAQSVVQSAVSSVMPQAQKKGVLLEAALAPIDRASLPLLDRERMRQVVTNLLANALKFTPKGGRITARVGEIAWQPELDGAGYRMSVEDTGVGIPEDQFEKIFQSFYQVDNTSTREYGGAGIGLAIVKSFVEGHGGKVLVESRLGQGTRFTLVLPVTPPMAPQGIQVAPPMLPEVPDRF
jgi:signal transduction histidine kinase